VSGSVPPFGLAVPALPYGTASAPYSVSGATGTAGLGGMTPAQAAVGQAPVMGAANMAYYGTPSYSGSGGGSQYGGSAGGYALNNPDNGNGTGGAGGVGAGRGVGNGSVGGRNEVDVPDEMTAASPDGSGEAGVIATALEALVYGWGQPHHAGLGGAAQLVRDQEILSDGWGEEAVEAAELGGTAGLAGGLGTPHVPGASSPYGMVTPVTTSPSAGTML
ncbi:hypothetical protein VaNZ11_010526, partial [Volvox africanus]